MQFDAKYCFKMCLQSTLSSESDVEVRISPQHLQLRLQSVLGAHTGLLFFLSVIPNASNNFKWLTLKKQYGEKAMSMIRFRIGIWFYFLMRLRRGTKKVTREERKYVCACVCVPVYAYPLL